MKEPIYNTIGTGYNTTRQADPYIAERLFQLLQPVPGKLYLDIGCGTGNYTMAMAGKGLHLYGVEPSEKMLQVAQQRSGDIKWFTGTAEQIPAGDHTFSGAIATLTIHHWTDLQQGLKEIHRVLEPGSRFVIFTSLPEQTEGFWLNHYFPKMMQASGTPAFSIIENGLKNAGMRVTATEKYFVQPDLKDQFLYIGKNNPELYFNPLIRNGISSFRAFANAGEVEQGLLKLRTDIDTGYFETVRQQYENELGDYFFIVAEKC